MISAARSLAIIATELERAMALMDDPSAHPLDVRMAVISAHTHAILQCSNQRRMEARNFFAAIPGLEAGPMQ